MIYLASASPRRAELLRQIGVAFSVLSAEVDETPLPGERAEIYVQRLALAKARAGWTAAQRRSDWPVLAADTSVVIDGEVLGKPGSETEGLSMLRRLSGRRHQVMTAIVVKRGEIERVALSVSQVGFRSLSEAEMLAYWQSGEGHDKAGGYAVQGLAARYIDYLEGSYSGVVGLPLHLVDALLGEPASH